MTTPELYKKDNSVSKDLPHKHEDLSSPPPPPEPTSFWTQWHALLTLVTERQEGETGGFPEAQRPVSPAFRVRIQENERLCLKQKVEGT